MGATKHLPDNLTKIVSEINTGLNRKSSPAKIFLYDQGIPALPTFAPAPPANIYRSLLKSPGSIYVLNCGGTNWEAVEVKIEDQKMTILPKKSTLTFTSAASRVFESLDLFSEKIADLLYRLIQKENVELESIAIVLGFPVQTVKIRKQIDTHFLESQLPKDWYIKGPVKNISVGSKVKAALEKKYGILTHNIVFGNDAALMMWDLSVEKGSDERIAHIGGVWGSGTNVGITRIRGNQDPLIINTEIGRSRSLLTSEDLTIFKKMNEMGCILPEEPELETFVGGDYLFSQFATRILNEMKKRKLQHDILKKTLKNLIQIKGNSEIVSNIRKNPDTNQIAKSLGLKGQAFLAPTVEIVIDSAEKTLSNAEDKIALTIAGCIIATNLDPDQKWVIPAEGSVLLHGERVLENVSTSLDQYLPDYSIRIDPTCSGKKAMSLFSRYIGQLKSI